MLCGSTRAGSSNLRLRSNVNDACMNFEERLKETLVPFPDLTDSDMIEMGKARVRVYGLMKDGLIHSGQDIIDASEIREGLRRLRELRQWFVIDTFKVAGSRDFCYQLKSKYGQRQRELGLKISPDPRKEIRRLQEQVLKNDGSPYLS